MTAVNRLVLRPVTLASTSIEVAVNPGCFRRLRMAYRRSCQTLSSEGNVHMARICSFNAVALPNRRADSRPGSTPDSPDAATAAARIARWKATSSARSRSRRRRLNDAVTRYRVSISRDHVGDHRGSHYEELANWCSPFLSAEAAWAAKAGGGPFSVAPQRLDRVDPRRAPCRQVAGGESGEAK